MLRIFLKKKLFGGKNTKTKDLASTDGRERRIHRRFLIDQQHLTLLNDQDILVIKDISAKGFSSDVSPQAFARFDIGELYEARIRYFGEIQDIQARVAWKSGTSVGFEIHKPQVEILLFFQRLLRPMQLASSLSPVEPTFMQDAYKGVQWYHGEDVDLHIWPSEEGQLSAWKLIADKHLVEWSSVHGLKTGEAQPLMLANLAETETGRMHRVMDETPNLKRTRLARDLFSALSIPEKTELIKSLETYQER